MIELTFPLCLASAASSLAALASSSENQRPGPPTPPSEDEDVRGSWGWGKSPRTWRKGGGIQIRVQLVLGHFSRCDLDPRIVSGCSSVVALYWTHHEYRVTLLFQRGKKGLEVDISDGLRVVVKDGA